MPGAGQLTGGEAKSKAVMFGVVGTGDPRIDAASRERCANIVKIVADHVAASVRMPDGTPAEVVWTPLLVDGEKQADIVGRMFREAGVDAVICTPDTWAFPQLTLMSLLAHLPADMPVNITCGNSGPKPGVVYAQAVDGAISADRPPDALERRQLAGHRLAPAAHRGHGQRSGGLVLRRADARGIEGTSRGGLWTRFDGHGNRPRACVATRRHLRPGNHPSRHEAPGRHAAKKAPTQAASSARCGLDRSASRQAARLSRQGRQRTLRPVVGLIPDHARPVCVDLNAVGGGFMSQLEWGIGRARPSRCRSPT